MKKIKMKIFVKKIAVVAVVVVIFKKKMIIRKIMGFFVIVIKQKEDKIGLINLLLVIFKLKYFLIC